MGKKIFKRLVAGILCVCLTIASFSVEQSEFLLSAAEISGTEMTGELIALDTENEWLEPATESESESAGCSTEAEMIEEAQEGTDLPLMEEIAREKKILPEKAEEERRKRTADENGLSSSGTNVRETQEISGSPEDIQQLEESKVMLGANGFSAVACGVIDADTTWRSGNLSGGTLTVLPGVTLTLTGRVVISEKVTINGGGTIARGTGGGNFLVNEGGELVLDDITIDGGKIDATYSMVEVHMGKLTMNDGSKISGCRKASDTNSFVSNRYGGGAALYVDYSTVILNPGATIEDCAAPYYGGAMFLYESNVTIYGGTYQGNYTTQGHPHGWGGGCIYNACAKLYIYGGNFLKNNTSLKGGCIYHTGGTGCETYLYGGYFQGNTSSGTEGSGAIYYNSQSSVNPGLISYEDSLTLSGNAQFGGFGTNNPKADGIYLDFRQNAGQKNERKALVSSPLCYPLNIFLMPSEGYVIAQGSEDYILTERDMKKITFHDIASLNKTWYAVLNKEKNQIYISATDPQYGLYVTYVNNGAHGRVSDDNRYASGDTVTVKSGKELTYDSGSFDRWNTKPDGSGTFYEAEDTLTITEDISLYAVHKDTIDAMFYSGERNEIKTMEDLEVNAEITTPDLEEMSGFTPLGWNREITGYEGEIANGAKLTLQRSTFFYGVYEKDVTLFYDAQGGQSAAESETKQLRANVHKETTYQDAVFKITADAASGGCRFIGWNTKADGEGTLYQVGDEIALTEDTTLYAVYERVPAAYRVEHYWQDVDGEGYTLSDEDTVNGNAYVGDEITAEPVLREGFVENTVYEDRKASGTAAEEGTLVLKLYYDRELYEIDFDLNGAKGDVPKTQTIRYGGLLQDVKEPARAGYSFKGWCFEGTDTRWDFALPVEENTAEKKTKLCAKWVDDIAPVLGEASYNSGYKDIFGWIIRKKDLILTVPVTEEGSGVKQADYVLLPDEEADAPRQADIRAGKRRSASAKEAQIDKTEGGTIVRFAISEDFSGKVYLTCTDHAGNVSLSKSMTAEDGRIIVEDNAPEILFSSPDGDPSQIFVDRALIHVDVRDDKVKDREVISGGLADVTYRIDGGEDRPADDTDYAEEAVFFHSFDVEIQGAQDHTLTVTATDNAGNVTERQIPVVIRAKEAVYRVEHYKQEAQGDGYTLADVELLSGAVGSEATAGIKSYAGFSKILPMRKEKFPVL